MSIKMMTRVWDYSEANGTDLLVLLALADMADDDGECWPSMSTIGHKCRLEPRNARKRIRSLEELGEVLVIMGGGKSSSKGGLRSNRYRITVHMDPDTDGTVPVEVEQMGTETSLSGDPDTDASVLQIGTPASSPMRTPASAESSEETSPNPLAPAKAGAGEFDILRDSVVNACGIDPEDITPSYDGALAKAVKDLLSVGAGAADVRRLAAIYREQHPTWELTPSALAKHWPALQATESGSAPCRLTDAQKLGARLANAGWDELDARSEIIERMNTDSEKQEALDAFADRRLQMSQNHERVGAS